MRLHLKDGNHGNSDMETVNRFSDIKSLDIYHTIVGQLYYGKYAELIGLLLLFDSNNNKLSAFALIKWQTQMYMQQT